MSGSRGSRVNQLCGNVLRLIWATGNQVPRQFLLGTLNSMQVNEKSSSTSTASGELLYRGNRMLFWLSTSRTDGLRPLFNGKAFFLYSTVELAEYAVRKLNDKPFFGRKLWVLISEQRLNVRTARGNVLGSSRPGTKIWDCVPAAGNREQTGNCEREGNRE